MEGRVTLLVWRHWYVGIMRKWDCFSPATFIPLAEETGLIVALDQWVMKTGMTQMREWYEAGLNPGRLSLNLSVKQLQQEDFIDIVKKTTQ